MLVVCASLFRVKMGLHQKPTQQRPGQRLGRLFTAHQWVTPLSLFVHRVREQASFLSGLRNIQNSLWQNNPFEGRFFVRCGVSQMGLRSGGRRGIAGGGKTCAGISPSPPARVCLPESSLHQPPDPHSPASETHLCCQKT